VGCEVSNGVYCVCLFVYHTIHIGGIHSV
jgi:hypothetical protein